MRRGAARGRRRPRAGVRHAGPAAGPAFAEASDSSSDGGRRRVLCRGDAGRDPGRLAWQADGPSSPEKRPAQEDEAPTGGRLREEAWREARVHQSAGEPLPRRDREHRQPEGGLHAGWPDAGGEGSRGGVGGRGRPRVGEREGALGGRDSPADEGARDRPAASGRAQSDGLGPGRDGTGDPPVQLRNCAGRGPRDGPSSPEEAASRGEAHRLGEHGPDVPGLEQDQTNVGRGRLSSNASPAPAEQSDADGRQRREPERPPGVPGKRRVGGPRDGVSQREGACRVHRHSGEAPEDGAVLGNPSGSPRQWTRREGREICSCGRGRTSEGPCAAVRCRCGRGRGLHGESCISFPVPEEGCGERGRHAPLSGGRSSPADQVGSMSVECAKNSGRGNHSRGRTRQLVSEDESREGAIRSSASRLLANGNVHESPGRLDELRVWGSLDESLRSQTPSPNTMGTNGGLRDAEDSAQRPCHNGVLAERAPSASASAELGGEPVLSELRLLDKLPDSDIVPEEARGQDRKPRADREFQARRGAASAHWPMERTSEIRVQIGSQRDSGGVEIVGGENESNGLRTRSCLQSAVLPRGSASAGEALDATARGGGGGEYRGEPHGDEERKRSPAADVRKAAGPESPGKTIGDAGPWDEDGLAILRGQQVGRGQATGAAGAARREVLEVDEVDELDRFMSSLEESDAKRRRRSSHSGSRLDFADDGEMLNSNVCQTDSLSCNSGGIHEGRPETASSSKTANGCRMLTSVGEEGDSGSGRFADDEDGDSSHLPSRQFAKDLMLPEVDHTSIRYPKLTKSVYIELPRLAETSRMSPLSALRCAGVIATGASVLAPIDRFQDLALSLPQGLLGVLLTKYATPTPVQRAVMPNALSGRDVITVAKTGSGKTVAYALPILAHVAAQGRRDFGKSGSGPSALVVTPTRELALQISSVLRSFASALGFVVSCIVGGASKYEQYKQLRDGGGAIAVFTPGRFIDMVRMKACALNHVSFVVVDEADRMIEALGFGPQVRTILGRVRPDAQKLFASATFPPSVRQLAEVYCSTNAVRLVVGRVSSNSAESEFDDAPLSNRTSTEDGDQRHEVLDPCRRMSYSTSAVQDDRAASVSLVSDDVVESYIVVSSEGSRLEWLLAHLGAMLEDGLVIVFGATRGGVASLSNELRARGYANACVHGETEMADRAGLMSMFRSGELRLLVATDVAGRGLDIGGVRNVVNYEPAKNWDDHVHRSGRTGRAGVKGRAHTLLLASSPRDQSFARSAAAALHAARAPVPPAVSEVLALAPAQPLRRRHGGRWRGDSRRGGRTSRRQ